MRCGDNAPQPVRLGDWLRELREGLDLPLRAVADATDMDLAHLHKIEHGQRLPTQEQTSRLAKFFKLDETEAQARRIAEKFWQDFAENPAAKEAISILAEEAGGYWAGSGDEHPSRLHGAMGKTASGNGQRET
jgi:transcriptional regulator with XRE-family HTH domain